MDNRVLTSTETAVTQNNKTNIEVTDNELYASPFLFFLKVKVVKIDGKTVIQSYFCLTCSSSANISNCAYVCVSEGQKCSLFRKFGVPYFL